MICADKNKKQFCRSLYIYRLQATQCNTEQLLKRFFDFLNVKIRVGKGEDTRTSKQYVSKYYFGPLRGCISLLSAVVVGLNNIVVGDLLKHKQDQFYVGIVERKLLLPMSRGVSFLQMEKKEISLNPLDPHHAPVVVLT